MIGIGTTPVNAEGGYIAASSLSYANHKISASLSYTIQVSSTTTLNAYACYNGYTTSTVTSIAVESFFMATRIA